MYLADAEEPRERTSDIVSSSSTFKFERRSMSSRAAILALASPPPVLADAPAPALLAVISPPPVLADARAPALLALVWLPPVLADAQGLGFRV